MLTHNQVKLQQLITAGKIRANSLNFATSIAYRVHATSKQLIWVDKLVEEAEAPPAVRQAATTLVVTGIVALFNTAAQHLKYPKVELELNGTPLTLRRAGNRSKEPGSISITNNGTYLGRICLTGDVVLNDAGLLLKASLVPFLQAFAADPAGIAASYGKLTGSCSFCARHLTDDRSLAVGYGKICAEHFSLPWGHTNVHKTDSTSTP